MRRIIPTAEMRIISSSLSGRTAVQAIGTEQTRVFYNRMFRERALERRARQEPLDDRLQITAPHEWLMVGGLVLVVVTLALYGTLVRVDRSVSYDAALVVPGAAPARPEAVALVSPADAVRLNAGDSAQVRVGGPGGDERVIPGQVVEVSAGLESPPGWLSDQVSAIPRQPHMVRVALDLQASDPPVAAAGDVSVRIVLGREPLVRLLVPRSAG